MAAEIHFVMNGCFAACGDEGASLTTVWPGEVTCEDCIAKIPKTWNPRNIAAGKPKTAPSRQRPRK